SADCLAAQCAETLWTGRPAVHQHEFHFQPPSEKKPLPSTAIRSLGRKHLNRTQVNAAHSVVLAAHTRVWLLSIPRGPGWYYGLQSNAALPRRWPAYEIRLGASPSQYADRCKSGLFAAIPRKRNPRAISIFVAWAAQRLRAAVGSMAGRGEHARHHHCVHAYGISGGIAGLWTVGEPVAAGAHVVSKADAARRSDDVVLRRSRRLLGRQL